MSKYSLDNLKIQSSQLLNNAKSYAKTPSGKSLAVFASILAIGGVVELSDAINVREDRVNQAQAAQNRNNFFRYTMLEDPKSLKTHGACADELEAEAKYYSRAAKIVGPDYGIYEGNQAQDFKYLNDNAKIYKKSAKLALANEVSCFPANSKMVSLTPHFELNTMINNHQCVSELETTPIEEVYSKPTKLAQDLAAANNAKREIAIDFAKSHNISC